MPFDSRMFLISLLNLNLSGFQIRGFLVFFLLFLNWYDSIMLSVLCSCSG